MKIIYSPHYDGEIFLGDQPGCFDTLYAGNATLLQQLGLRTGICVAPASDMEREAAYQTAMDTPLKGTCFESSAKTDPIGVAAKLLLWRDNLIMAGWDGTCTDPTLTKLHVLAEIEKEMRNGAFFPGNADFWRRIFDHLDNNSFQNSIAEIQIDCPWSEIPYLVQRTFKVLKNKGTRLELTVDENKSVDLQTDKISVVKFDDLLDAYEWISQVKDFPNNCAIVNRDNARLNHTLYTWDKPAVHATLTQSNPQLLQLFKLSLSIFSRPLNLGNLVSYLQLPLSPIPGTLRFQLARILLKNGGFGEEKPRKSGSVCDDWEDAILTYEFVEYDKDGNPKSGDSKKVRAEKMAFLNPVRQDFSDGIPQNELNNYVEKMQEWIRGFLGLDDLPDERKKQFHQLSSMFSAFKQVLVSLPDHVSYKDIVKMVLRIYRPMSYSWQQSEKGSLNVIGDLRGMAVPADTLIWLDCQDEEQGTDPYDFLSTAERQYLASKGVLIPDFAQYLKIRRQERNCLLNSVKEKVVLVQSEYDGVKRLGEHSLVAEVKHLLKKIDYADADAVLPKIPQTPNLQNIDTFGSQMHYDLKINGVGMSAFKGRKESNSSIDMLIQRPFNYVMQYVAQLPAPNDEQLSSPYVTAGLVAHHFFQHIIEDGKKAATGAALYDTLRNLATSQYDKYLGAAVNAKGLILLADENATQLHNFRWQLRKSMQTLIDIMEELKLKPEGCEMVFQEKDGKALKLSTIGAFEARIDFLLSDSNGDYVIFDFKWSFAKRYVQKLEDNASIQLELYRQSVRATYPDKKVVGVGYYMMPRQKLFTTDFSDWNNMICKVTSANSNDLFQQIQNAYTFRKEELEKGHIEEGELMDVLPFTDNYYNKQNEKKLCSLDVVEKYEGRGKGRTLVGVTKNSEYVYVQSKKKSFDFDEKEPYETPTSHPILKGRLK